MVDKTEFKVGQTIYVVYSETNGYPNKHTITKIGKKWIYYGKTEKSRFNPKTMKVDYNGPSSATVWKSMQDYKNFKEKLHLLDRLKELVSSRGHNFENISNDSLKYVLEILSR